MTAGKAIIANLVGVGLDEADSNAIVGINKQYVISPTNTPEIIGDDGAAMIDPDGTGWTIFLTSLWPVLHGHVIGGIGKNIRWTVRINFDMVTL